MRGNAVRPQVGVAAGPRGGKLSGKWVANESQLTRILVHRQLFTAAAAAAAPPAVGSSAVGLMLR